MPLYFEVDWSNSGFVLLVFANRATCNCLLSCIPLFCKELCRNCVNEKYSLILEQVKKKQLVELKFLSYGAH